LDVWDCHQLTKSSVKSPKHQHLNKTFESPPLKGGDFCFI
jgi:hypothetical protein